MNYEGKLDVELFKAIQYAIGNIYLIAETHNICLDKNYVQLIPKNSKYFENNKLFKVNEGNKELQNKINNIIKAIIKDKTIRRKDHSNKNRRKY